MPHLCFTKPFRKQNSRWRLKSERTTITKHSYYKTTRLFLSVLENITTNTEWTHPSLDNYCYTLKRNFTLSTATTLILSQAKYLSFLRSLQPPPHFFRSPRRPLSIRSTESTPEPILTREKSSSLAYVNSSGTTYEITIKRVYSQLKLDLEVTTRSWIHFFRSSNYKPVHRFFFPLYVQWDMHGINVLRLMQRYTIHFKTAKRNRWSK